MKKLEEELKKAWYEWHKDIEMPNPPTPGFRKGFEAAWENRQEVIDMVGGAFFRLDKYGYLHNGIYGLDDNDEAEARHWIDIGRQGLKER